MSHWILHAIIITLLSLVLFPEKALYADDWSIRKDGFNPALVKRYKSLLQRKPNDRYALKKLLTAYKKHRTIRELLKEYRKLALNQKRSFAIQLVTAHLHRMTGYNEEAIDFYLRAQSLHPKDPRVYSSIAALYKKQNKYIEAENAYQQSLSLTKNKKIKIHHLKELMSIARAQNDQVKINRYLQKLIKLNPQSTMLRMELAQALKANKRYDKAIEEYEKLLKKVSDSSVRSTIYKEIGELHQKQDSPQKAIAIYRKAIKLTTRGHWIRRELTEKIINIYRQQDNLKGLIEYYTKRWKRRGYFEWFILAKLYAETGDEDQAVKAYTHALKKNPRSIDTRLKLISLLERGGKTSQVIKEYRILSKIASNEPRYKLDLAKRLHQYGKIAEALNIADRLARTHHKDPAVQSALAELYTHWNKKKRALARAKVLIKLEPKDETHIIHLGEHYYQRGKKQLAIATWMRLLNIVAKKHRSYAKLAEIFGDHGMHDHALRYYKKAIKIKKNYIPYQRGLALLYERHKKYAEALHVWNNILTLAKSEKSAILTKEARVHKVDILAKTYRLKHEIRQKRHLFNMSPPDIDSGFFIALAFQKERKFKEAITIYEAILKVAPDNSEALNEVEQLYRRVHRYAKAIDSLKKLAKLNPSERKNYYHKIAQLQLRLFNDKEAIRYANKALALGRKDFLSYLQLGRLFEQKGDTTSAIKAYEQALTLNPHLHRASFALGRIHSRLGNYKKAYTAYRSIILNGQNSDEILRAFRKGVVLASYLKTLETLERKILPKAMAGSRNSETYRSLLVDLYLKIAPQFISSLEMGSHKEKKQAKTKLRHIGLRGLTPLLIELSSQHLQHARKEKIINVLGYLENPNAVAPLLRIVEEKEDKDYFVIYSLRYSSTYRKRNTTNLRLKALIAAGKLRDSRAIPTLLRLSKHKSQSLREAAYWAISQLNDKRLMRHFIGGLKDPSSLVRSLSCLALGRNGYRPGIPMLKEMIFDPERSAEVRAACTLGYALLSKDSESILHAYQRGTSIEQRAAIKALSKLDDRRGLGALVKNIWTRSQADRSRILAAMNDILFKKEKSTLSIPALRLQWDDINRQQFYADLFHVANTKRLPIHILLSFDENEKQAFLLGLKEALARHFDILIRVLAELDSNSKEITLGQQLSEGFASLDPGQKKQFKRIKSRVEDTLRPFLKNLISSDSLSIRQHAFSLLVKLAKKKKFDFKDFHQQLLNEKNCNIILHAITPLTNGTLTDPQMIEFILALTKSEHWQVREAALTLILKHPIPLKPVFWTRMISDPNAFVRYKAAQLLQEVIVDKNLESWAHQHISKDPIELIRNLQPKSHPKTSH